MTSAKPTIILVHGSWHHPRHYSNLIQGLENASYKVICPDLPSSGTPIETFAEDVTLVRSAIEQCITRNEEVVLVMHSYGGVVGGEAVKGLIRGASGGGVVKMVYLAAFILPEGMSLYDWAGGKDGSWWEPVGPNLIKTTDTRNVFYHDVDDETAERFMADLSPQSRGVFESRVTYEAWKHIDSAYIICEQDRALPPVVQEGCLSIEGNRFSHVERLPTSHSPWLSKPVETVAAVRRAVGEDL